MSRIFILKSNNTVTLSVNGKTQQFSHETEDQATEFLNKVAALREQALNGEAEPIEELTGMLDPLYRQDSIAGLIRDSRDNYYLGNIAQPLPDKLVSKIIEYNKANLPTEPLVNFWKLLMLNPDEHVRDSLFNFADKFSFPITDKGYFIAYKSVAWIGEQDKEYAIFLSTEYIYKKAAGKDCSKLVVYSEQDMEYTDTYHFRLGEETDELKGKDVVTAYVEDPNNWEHRDIIVTPYEYSTLTDEQRAELKEIDDVYYRDEVTKPSTMFLGYLKDEFNDIHSLGDAEVPTFTDWHTKRQVIKLGQPVKLDRSKCDNDPDNTCSRGLHVGAPGYVAGFCGGADRYILATLVNPMNVVAVPNDYDFEKMRTCEYLPYAICKLTSEGNIEEIDTRYFEDDYCGYETEELERELDRLEKLSLNNDEENLEERKAIIRNRLITIG